jgi:hypothetical protein
MLCPRLVLLMWRSQYLQDRLCDSSHNALPTHATIEMEEPDHVDDTRNRTNLDKLAAHWCCVLVGFPRRGALESRIEAFNGCRRDGLLYNRYRQTVIEVEPDLCVAGRVHW